MAEQLEFDFQLPEKERETSYLCEEIVYKINDIVLYYSTSTTDNTGTYWITSTGRWRWV